ncbi:hypothetical protein HAX54_021333 [Datura stramonium]|uniref:Uncharacterized protein n=1 Tax=Datura stramonium TaxID=4076 RepID=A0ABS8UU40_DATST|nr:hypothetical protein [Datura stramonium]
MVDEVDGLISLLEYTSPNKESFTAFNKERDGGVQEEDVDVHYDEPEAGTTTEPVTAETVAATHQAAATEQSNSDFSENSTGTRNDVGSNDVDAGTSNPVGPNDIARTAATIFAPSRGRGRPRKATITFEEPTRGKGRPRKDSSTSKAAESPVRGRGRPRQATSTSKEAEATARGRGRPRQTTSTSEAVEAPARGRGRSAKDFSISEAAEVPARGIGKQPKDSSATEAAKASSRVGIGVFAAKDGFTTYNYGLPSSRILHYGARQPIRSAEITGDLGFKPRTGVRWKSKAAITTGQLEEMRLNKRKKLSSVQSREPWK